MMSRTGGAVAVMVTLMIIQASSAQDTITPLTSDSSTTQCDYKASCAQECKGLVDSYGCPYCYCPPTCETVDCRDGYVCEMQELMCFVPPCPKYPRCVPIVTTTPLIPDSSTTQCDYKVSCAQECKMLVDSYGCPYCDCPPTCETVDCRDGYVCEMQEVWCFAPPCPKYPRCVPIVTTTPLIPDSSTTKCDYEVSCRKECKTLVDSYGCPYCDCPLTCETVDCRDGYVCEMQAYPCFVPPCPTHPVCVPIKTTTPCPYVKCARGCVPVRGANGCPKCVCPRTCQDVNCTKDQKCVLKQVYCIAYPCFPIPSCVPKNGPKDSYV